MSKDVAALRAAATSGEWSANGAYLIAGHYANVDDLMGQMYGRRTQASADAAFIVAAANAIGAGAILIDPTAPETVAALAAALYYDDPLWSLSPRKPDSKIRAAAILPAFVARLRGET